MQELQHTRFTSLMAPGQLRNEMGLSPIGHRFAAINTANAAGSKENSDIKRPWFKRCEA